MPVSAVSGQTNYVVVASESSQQQMQNMQQRGVTLIARGNSESQNSCIENVNCLIAVLDQVPIV